MKPKSILAYDIDGTLTPRNQLTISPIKLVALLKYLEDLGHLPLLVTGKPAAYAQRVLESSNLPLKGLIAENAGIYQVEGDEPKVFGEGITEIKTLKSALGLSENVGNITTMTLDEKVYEVVVDPDDLSILTIFTNPQFVSHRWNFSHSIEVDFLYEKLLQLIEQLNLQNSLQVLPPFPDEAIQVIRINKETNTPIDKSMLSAVVSVMFDVEDSIPKAMFGDGHNDIPAMLSKGVIPMTFANAEEAVKQTAQSENGYISKYNAIEDVGIIDGILWLANKETFFGSDSKEIKKFILSNFSQLRQNTPSSGLYRRAP